jgi:hypothetical protein
MNKRPSDARLKWTIPSLNHILGAHHDLLELRQQKKEVKQKYVASTVKNAQSLCNHIDILLGKTDHMLMRDVGYSEGFWYSEEVDDLTDNTYPSDKLETAYNNVADWFVEHQDLWDDLDRVRIKTVEKNKMTDSGDEESGGEGGGQIYSDKEGDSDSSDEDGSDDDKGSDEDDSEEHSGSSDEEIIFD